MSLEVTSAPMLAVDSAQERSQHRGAGEQSWEVKQHRILTGSLEHLNHILPKVSVNSAVLGSPGGPDSEESACNAGDRGSIPGSGRSPGEGRGNPLQYSRLENPMDRGAWRATVHGVAKSRTQPSDQQTLSVTLGLFLFLRPRDSLLFLNQVDLNSCHLQRSILPKANNTSAGVQGSAWKPAGKGQVKAGARSCKQPGTPDAVRLSRTTPWRPGPSPSQGNPALTPMLSWILRTTCNRRGSPQLRGHMSQGTTELGSTQASPAPGQPCPLPHKAPASNPNPGESRRGLLRASLPIPGLQLMLRCFSRGSQVRKEASSLPPACGREGSSRGEPDGRKPETTGPGLCHPPPSPQLEEGLWSRGAGPGKPSRVCPASHVFLTSTRDPRVPKPAAHTSDTHQCVCVCVCVCVCARARTHALGWLHDF